MGAPGQVQRTFGEVSLELPPLAEFVGTGRMVVSSLARHYGFADEQVEDLRVAVSEALTSSVRAHGEAGIEDPILLNVSMEGDALTITVSDKGTEIVEEIADVRMTPTGSWDVALGLTLIRSLIPEMTFEVLPGTGRTLTLTLKPEGAPD